MKKCACGRKLRSGEDRCPACASKTSHRWKMIFEGAGVVAAVVGGIVIHILSGGEGGGSA
jgi:hypothetical protein